MFFQTGVAAQNAALAVHSALPFLAYRTEPPPCFVVHATSHLIRYEEDAYSKLLGVNALLAGDEERVMCARDIEVHLARLAAVGCAPSMILVELPHRELGCETPSWDELVQMRKLADQYGVPMHLDGARLWEIAPYYAETAGVSISEIVRLFDSAYVSFYKGLGALTGAMLLGDRKFIGEAGVWRRRLGANPYTSMPYALSCRDAFRRHADTFGARWQKMRRLVPLLAAAAEAEGATFRTIPAEPQSCQAHACIAAGGATEAAMDAARDAVEAECGVRLYGRLLGRPPEPPAARDGGSGGDEEAAAEEHYFEWHIGPGHVELDDALFVEAWASFFRELARRGVST